MLDASVTDAAPARRPGDIPRSDTVVSFVLPVFNEQEGIRRFHEELTAVLADRPELLFELVYVNDGSQDASLDILRDLAKNDPQVRIVDFARNYGHQIAITAGLDEAVGDAVTVMDTDLQDPPRVCLELIDAWRGGAEVVHARRRTRRDSTATTASSAAAHSGWRTSVRGASASPSVTIAAVRPATPRLHPPHQRGPQRDPGRETRQRPRQPQDGLPHGGGSDGELVQPVQEPPVEERPVRERLRRRVVTAPQTGQHVPDIPVQPRGHHRVHQRTTRQQRGNPGHSPRSPRNRRRYRLARKKSGVVHGRDHNSRSDG
ncbi:glycosyltransferase family 2 protein [Streptomyces sp. NPDC006997]|uniref:glycosyltransferase family 2 protein n=1 Tax=Streptomyces sp. NPDC006997 TaxID=3155356 RepID=UPI0033D7A152